MRDDLIVAVDEKDTLLGYIERGVAHDERELRWHREVMLLLYTGAGRKNFLLQHRSMKKKQLPGYWTLSVTGHVDFNDLSRHDPEGYVTAAKREAKEEIGVDVKNLELVTKLPQRLPQNLAMMGVVIGEYSGEIQPDPKEVSEVAEFSKQSVQTMHGRLTPGAEACLKYLNLL